MLDTVLLWLARGAILRALLRIRREKETNIDNHHEDGECGFQLVSELYPNKSWRGLEVD